MKKRSLFTVKLFAFAALSILSSYTLTVTADESNSSDIISIESVSSDADTAELFSPDITVVESASCYKLDPNVIYEIDIDGDDIAEPLSYLSYTNEGVSDNQEYFSNAVLDFFLDGAPYYSLIDQDWTYYWKVYAFEPDDGKSYLLASSIGDSDWTNQSLILTKNPDSNELMSLGDLVTITRDSDTVTENLLGQWARSLDIADAKDGTFTVTWLISAMCTGNIGVSITYNIDSTGISIKDTPIPLSEIKEWTSWRDFDVQISPEDSTTAFHVSPDEKVTLTEFQTYNNHYYLKCRNAQGEEGWIYDPDEIYSAQPEGSDQYLMGYFKEALFAG